MKTEKSSSYFLKSDKVPDFLKVLAADFSVYVPRKINETIHYGLFDPDRGEKEGIIFGGIRATEPLKSFFFPAQEKLGTYFGGGKEEEEKPLAIAGAKSCDLHSLKIFDLIFGEGDFLDPTYVARREKSLIVASDCSSFAETCFCLLVDVNPYPEKGFDIGLSEVDGGFVVAAGTEKGRKIMEKNSGLFSSAEAEKIQEVERRRKKVKEELEQALKEYQIKVPWHELLRKNFASPVWKETTKTCVECGGCVLSCPTCYCFLLSDEQKKGGFERKRTWDSCQYAGFARVAGGANPRKKLAERLRHRYLHKFDYLKESYDLYACTGCGRCIAACMGKIDMRKVFVDLAK